MKRGKKNTIQSTRQRELSPQYREIQKKLHGYKVQMKQKPTLAEKKFRTLLKNNGIMHQSQRMFYSTDGQYIVDFYIKSDGANIVIEIDGGYHLTEDQQRRDKRRTDWLITKRKCAVIRFSNEDVFDNPDLCMNQLAKLYLSKIKRSLSKNYKAFCLLLGISSYEKKILPVSNEPIDWGNDEPLF